MINRRSEQVAYSEHGHLIRKSLHKSSCVDEWLRIRLPILVSQVTYALRFRATRSICDLISIRSTLTSAFRCVSVATLGAFVHLLPLTCKSAYASVIEQTQTAQLHYAFSLTSRCLIPFVHFSIQLQTIICHGRSRKVTGQSWRQ